MCNLVSVKGLRWNIPPMYLFDNLMPITDFGRGVCMILTTLPHIDYDDYNCLSYFYRIIYKIRYLSSSKLL